ncbi:MAG: Hsp33 family molecular chaperone HslO [Candidatus Tectimicrobiota bacterium]
MISTVVEGEHIYGVAAVTTQLVAQAQQIHGACPTAAAALGRLLTGGGLLGCLLKEPAHRVALQVLCKGPVQKIHVEADGAGTMRGYLGQPVVNLPSRHGKLDVGGAVGKGVLHVLKHVGLREPYSGAVPLATGEIAEDMAVYFSRSEQIPSAVSLGVFVNPRHHVQAAGGFLVQFHATIAEDLVVHIEQSLAAAPAVTTMIREGYTPEEMLACALGGLPAQTLRSLTPTWTCQCSRERVVQTLVALGAPELRDMVAEHKDMRIRCEFCVTEYILTPQELQEILEEAMAEERNDV